MRRVFVAGSGTDLGKTYVSAALLRAGRAAGWRVRAFKPLVSGSPDLGEPGFELGDPAVLMRAAGESVTAEALERCSPWRYAAPLSPDMAAAAEGRVVPFEAVAAWTRHRLAEAGCDLALAEGVGGVMSPIAEAQTCLDLMAAVDAPVILVCGGYLGAVSHGLTALEAVRRRGLEVASLVVNESPQGAVPMEATLHAFHRFAGGVSIHALRRGGAGSLSWLGPGP